MNNRGSIAVMSAVLTIPLLLFAGLAVDVSRLWLLRQRMQWAVDTAALLGASQVNGESADSVTKDAQELFWVSYGASTTTYHPPKPPAPPAPPPAPVLQTGFLGSSSAGATVVVAPAAVTAADGTTTPPNVTVTASATLPTSIMQMIGTTMSTVMTTSSAAVPHKIEMTLVLDNSLSMGFAVSGSSTNKLDALKLAAHNLLTTILGSGSSPNVSIGIVPFAGAVNVGNDSIGQSFLKDGTLADKFAGSTADGFGWRGCVQARAYAAPAVSYDTTEDSPSTAKFDPYYNPSTKNVAPKNKPYYTGDNDWTVGSINDTNAVSQTTNTNYLAPGGLWFGPNLFCPHSPLVKLTSDRTALDTAITNMAMVNGGGTIINQGLQWGWFTLSPLWTVWNLPSSPTGAARPAAYSDTGTTKIIVLMTDGTNEVDGVDSFYGSAASYNPYNTTSRCDAQMIYPECYQADSWYTSYGRASSGVLTPTSGKNGDTLRSNAKDTLTSRLKDPGGLCSNIKTNVVIYTIFFHGPVDDYYGDPQAGSYLSTCATDSNHYFDSQSASAINAAFQKIAQDINDLKIRK